MCFCRAIKYDGEIGCDAFCVSLLPCTHADLSIHQPIYRRLLMSRVVIDHRNMTEIGHAFFQLYSRDRRSTVVIKTLKKTSKSVRRYMKSWGLKKIFKEKNFFRLNSNLSEMPRNSIKKLDPPSPLPDTFENRLKAVSD